MAKKTTKPTKRTVPVTMTQTHFEKIAKSLGVSKSEADKIWAAAPSDALRRSISEDEAKQVIGHDPSASNYSGGDDAAADDASMGSLASLLGLDLGDGDDLPDFGDGI